MRNLIASFSVLLLFYSSISTVECSRHRRMINGNLTKPNEIKYIVFIEAIDEIESRTKKCNGGIIDKYHILTSANCVIDKATNNFKPSRFKINAGTNDLNSTLPKIERFVEKIMVPNVYNGSHWEFTFEFTPVIGDIAVLKLKEPLDLSLTDKLESLELPSVDEKNRIDDSYLEGQTLQLASFGWNNMKEVWGEKGDMWMFFRYDGYADGKLMKADVTIYDHEECDKESIRRVDETYLCAKMVRRFMSEWRGVCKGDIGSPLVYNHKVAVGVVSSHTSSCNENGGPTKYTRVASFRQFIDDAVMGLTDGMRSKTADENGRF